jgi:LysM repeat protein
VVQQGDTLSSIAQRFGTTVDELVRINGLASQDVIIDVGQKLLVPSAPTPAP